jgi:predicted RNA-binding Zn ribbon-like protein
MGSLETIRDFVNTADLEEGKDSLTDPEARDVREAIRELLRANNGIVDADVAAASRTLDDAARRAGLRVGFAAGRPTFTAHEHSRAAGALEALTTAMSDGSWTRLKACRSDTCRWAFIDTARNRSRHWCDMAVCGNREKARRFRGRHA